MARSRGRARRNHPIGSGELGAYLASLPNPLAVWTIDDIVGTTLTAIPDGAFNGTHSGFTMGQATNGKMGRAALVDGTNDHGAIGSTKLTASFNSTIGTMLVIAKVSGAGVWTDSTARMMMQIAADGNNRITMQRETTNGRISYGYRTSGGGGADELVLLNSLSSTDWMVFACTWNVAGVGFSAFYNGAQTGSSQAIAGTFTGTPDTTLTNIGAYSNTPALVWDGYIAMAGVWFADLTDYMAEIYTRTGLG